MDASITFVKTGNLSHIERQMLEADGILQMISNHHGTFPATHKTMYTYLPCNLEKIKHTGKVVLLSIHCIIHFTHVIEEK